MQATALAVQLLGMAPNLSAFRFKRFSIVREKWQPVGESNPSFQVENLAS